MSYILKLLLIGIATLLFGAPVLAAALFDRRGTFAYACTRLWSWTILRTAGISLRVEGLERLDPDRQYVFMANHQSALDIPVLVQAMVPFQLRWLAKKELLRVPFFGWAVWSARHILVDRSSRTQALASLAAARKRIEEGISVVIFPEGTRGREGCLLPFKRGGFILALRAETPIVPVVIQGSGAIFPKGEWRLRRGSIGVVVCDPIALDAYDAKDVNRLVERVRDQIEMGLGRRNGFAGASSGAEFRACGDFSRWGYLWSP